MLFDSRYSLFSAFIFFGQPGVVGGQAYSVSANHRTFQQLRHGLDLLVTGHRHDQELWNANRWDEGIGWMNFGPLGFRTILTQEGVKGVSKKTWFEQWT